MEVQTDVAPRPVVAPGEPVTRVGGPVVGPDEAGVHDVLGEDGPRVVRADEVVVLGPDVVLLPDHGRPPQTLPPSRCLNPPPSVPRRDRPS